MFKKTDIQYIIKHVWDKAEKTYQPFKSDISGSIKLCQFKKLPLYLKNNLNRDDS